MTRTGWSRAAVSWSLAQPQSHARTPARPHPRVFPIVREKSSREIQGEKKVRLVRLFTDPEPRELSVGNGSLSLSLARGCVRLAACRRVDSAHAASARATGGSINPHSNAVWLSYCLLYIGRTEYISNTCISNTVFEIQIVFQILYFKYNTKCILYFVFQIGFVFEMPKKILDNNPWSEQTYWLHSKTLGLLQRMKRA